MNLLLLLSFSVLQLAPFTHAAKLVLFASGFKQPVAILDDPLANGTRKFVVEKGGLVKILNSKGNVTGTFLNLMPIVTQNVGEGGLLGMAFHPDYRTNRLLFVDYTTRIKGTLHTSINGKLHTVIRRLTCQANNPSRVTVGNATKETVLKFQQPYDNHNGGQILFSPVDKMLYIASGDGGSGGDPNNTAQSLDTFLGKILRINPFTTRDGQASYAIPSDNPFANSTVIGRKKEIWHYGLRNPWRFTFDRSNGNIFIGDVGQKNFEEINHALRLEKGLNFGWRLKEGDACFDPNCVNSTIKTRGPIVVYNHSVGCSVTGGYRYRGTAIPSLRGKYVYADYCTGTIWAATKIIGTYKWSSKVLLDKTKYAIASFGEDNNGELYVVDIVNGKIYKLQDN